VERVRAAIERQVLGLTGIALKEIDYEHPAGEPGLFGPRSVIWQVHGDFTSMMCGGISALLLQMLHPLALAGVWDHSNFREDMLGRLRRTSQFISATTFGTTRDAERLIERVKHIHLQVSGYASDGTPYEASDPQLLTWVHVAECSSFMAAHLRYRRPGLAVSEQDRYYREAARIAEALGARDVPTSSAAIADYLQAQRPQLCSDWRTREVANLLLNAPAPSRLARLPGALMMRAGIDLLPDWAAQMLGLHLSTLQRHIVRPGVHGIARVLRASVRNAAYHCAMRRMGENPVL
jgi:uncharacterized protein (DUF2236 family)